MRDVLGISYSRLDLRPIDKSKPRHAPFVFMFYLDTREGSYVTFGKHVHRTLMRKKADKGVTTSTGGKK